jgi:hypothetical protein
MPLEVSSKGPTNTETYTKYEKTCFQNISKLAAEDYFVNVLKCTENGQSGAPEYKAPTQVTKMRLGW